MDHPLPTFQNANFGCNASLLGSAFATTKVPAFISLQDCIGTVWDYTPLHKGLQANWQEAMAAQLGSALPLFKSGAVVGVFLGDEIMCSKIPFSNYSAVATATRKWLIDSGVPGALIYSNECSTPLTKSGQTWSVPDKLPAELDLFSIDLYAARASHSNPSSDPRKELEEVQKMVADHMRPRLHPHQRLMLVPGLFGDRNTTRSGTMEAQEEYLLAKLNATVAYAESQPDIVGVIPWHWLSPPKSYGIYSTIFGLGIESFPKLIARLNELKIKTDDDNAASAPGDYRHSGGGLFSTVIGSGVGKGPTLAFPLKGDDDEGERSCASDTDCSLNGRCNAGACSCDRPWTGKTCGQLAFRPVTMPQGYGMAPNKTTWCALSVCLSILALHLPMCSLTSNRVCCGRRGGNILTEDGKQFHLYVSAMTNECGLGHWSSNSRIEHAVANRPEGPFKFVDVAVSTWAHNSAPIVLHDGTFAIVHIGAGNGKVDGGRNCTPNGTNTVANDVPTTGHEQKPPKPKGSRIHVSNAIGGPFLPLNDSGSLPKDNCDNPAPWQHPNGTLYVACGREIKGNLINLWRAKAISGPWSFVTGLNNTFPTPTPRGKKEDVSHE